MRLFTAFTVWFSGVERKGGNFGGISAWTVLSVTADILILVSQLYNINQLQSKCFIVTNLVSDQFWLRPAL